MAQPTLQLFYWLRRGAAGLVAIGCLSSVAAAADDGLRAMLAEASARGECIDQVIYRVIRERGPGEADEVVRAALAALHDAQQRQRELGCSLDIAAKAIAAGADPDVILKATAAGL